MPSEIIHTGRALETMEVNTGPNSEVAMPSAKESISEASSSQDGVFEQPTEEELGTLRRVSGQIPWTAYTIAFVELYERFSYYGEFSE